MAWVWQGDPDIHRCCPPSEAWGGRPIGGTVGDLWRCTCGALWRIALACDLCDRRGRAFPHHGGHAVGEAWRTATLLQRLKYFTKGRTK